MIRLIHRRHRDVVADVREQTTQASQLVGIAGQELLADPRTNPRVRPLADALLTSQHEHALKAAHSRVLRRYRVSNRGAEHAEEMLEAVRQARQMRSPARSVLALQKGRRYWMTTSLGLSVALSVGAASGVAALAAKLDAPELAGWVAEAGGTVLSTAAISYRAHLAAHDDQPSGWHNCVLWALTFVPLTASVAANVFGAGPVGVLCSLGAAAFALLAHVVGEASAAAMQKQAARVTEQEERELQAAVLEHDLFAAPAPKVQVQPEAPTRTPAIEGVREQVNQQVREPARNPLVICSANLNPVKVHVNREPANRNPVNREPRTGEPANREPVRPVICSGKLNHLVRKPANQQGVNREPACGKVRKENHEPADANQSVREQRTASRRPQRGAADLSTRAARKQEEIRQVLALIEERGLEAVSLDVVMRELGFKKTTAYHRLKDAREQFANLAKAS